MTWSPSMRMSSHRSSLSLSFLALTLLLCFSAASTAHATSPAQPTNLAAFHRSGQTFITWTERADITGERYRVYRHSQPITAANLAQATRLYEVWEGSARFFADRYNVGSSGVWQARYVDRFVISDGGSQLPAGTGLLVWTLASADFGGGTSGNGYYAITAVDAGGVENIGDFGAANTFGPVTEQVNDPLPVEILTGDSGRGHAFTQFMDLRQWNPTFHAPHAGNQYYGLSASDPAVAQAIQYAYTYVVGEPNPENCGGSVPATLPLILYLHGWGGNSYGPDVRATNYYCAVEIRPVDISETWYFGFARDHDYRQSGAVASGDTIVNYTEQRILRMIYDLLRHPTIGPRVDRNRIYLWGHSMGGSGTLALALRYPNIFAAAYASQPMTNYRTGGGWRGDVIWKWGEPALNLPVQLSAPGGWASHLQKYNSTGVWDWQNHQANVQNRLGDEMVPFGIAHGLRDTSIQWPTQGQPFYAAVNAGRRSWGGQITNDDHTWESFQGLPPDLDVDMSLAPFFGFQVVLNESVPGLANASGNLPLPPTTTGGYNQTLEWSALWDNWDGAPVDTASEWRLSLRTTDATSQTVDVTPRRLQAFHITPGSTYQWENRRASDNSLVASGAVIADGNGLVIVPGFAVSAVGNRLILRPAGPVTTVTPTPTATPTPTPTATLMPLVAGTPRPLPDTTSGIHVFNDQLSSLNPALIAFSASHYAGTQKMTRADADVLRAAKPNFVILHYRLGPGLGYRAVTGACVPNGAWLYIINGDWVQEWPGDAVVQDAWFYRYGGQRVYHCGWGWYLMQLDNPGWRTWWTEAVLAQLANNDDDGLFSDSLSVPNYLGASEFAPPLPDIDAAFESEWTTRIQNFIAYVQSRFAGRYYLIPNVGGWVTSRDAVDYSGADGVMIEGFGYDAWGDWGEADWALQMNRALGIIQQGKAVIGQAYQVDNVNSRLFTLGSYLLVKGSKTYINLEWGQEPEWWPEYDIPIGAPQGVAPADVAALYNAGWGVYARQYTNGLVLVNAGSAARTVNLGGTYYLAQPTGGGMVPESGVLPSAWKVNYSAVTQVALQPGRATILLAYRRYLPMVTR